MDTYGEMNQKNAIAAAETLLGKPKNSKGCGRPRGSNSKPPPKRRVPASEQATQPRKSSQKDRPAVAAVPSNQPAPVPLDEHVPYMHQHVNICSALASIIRTSADEAQVVNRCAGKEKNSKMKLFKQKKGFLEFLGSMDRAESKRVRNSPVAVIMKAVLAVWKRTDPCASPSSPRLSTGQVRTGHATGAPVAAFAAATAPTTAAAMAAATAVRTAATAAAASAAAAGTAAAAAAATAAGNLSNLQHRQQNTQLSGASFTGVPPPPFTNGPQGSFMPNIYSPMMSNPPIFPSVPLRPFGTGPTWVVNGQSAPVQSATQAQWSAAHATDDIFE
jgi:hypothetical protein